ncbi:hypothetical protein CIRMBP1292_01902 [Enterococcus cecorum]|nr:hypothetical protein CIRMBP1221_00798 [Enterococcus cecorum]CAI3391221.1 hypothetical protein CIRMBP1220_01456 [Enterococcus cecorum]CAI3520210.1 hypothetical protein CIRMBP1292_01902 [Enterococcus cecorum]
MKIIEILKKVANGEIEKGTKFILNDNLFIFNGRMFESNELTYLENCIFLNEKDLNREVELIQPMKKKYLIKVNIQGLHEDFAYLNYSELQSYVVLDSKFDFERCRTQFTKKELQSIKPVKEFLDDMQGKYELVEVEDNEID